MPYQLLQTTFFALLLYVMICMFRWFRRRQKIFRIFKELGIPGPEPNFFIGNFHELRAEPDPNDVMTRWMEQYGKTFGYFIGENPHLVVRDLTLIKQALIQDFWHFPNRPNSIVSTEPLMYTIIALKGQRWKDVRKIMAPSLTSSKIRMMMPIMNEKIMNMIHMLEKKARANEMFDMYEVMQGLTLDVITESALSIKTNCLENPQDPLFVALKKFFLPPNSNAFKCALCFPFITSTMAFIMNFFPSTQLIKKITNNLREVIAQRRKNTRDQQNDILQMVMDADDNRGGLENNPSSIKKNIHLTVDEIIANLFVFLIAGYETTSASLAFTFYLLVQHPEVQEKLYEEITSAITDDTLSYDAVQSLQYLDQVFTESVRMYPAITLALTRECVKECKLGDIVVPKGVNLQVPVWNIHHDPKLWPDPWKFDPDRFSPENKSRNNSMAFLGFGAGPRICIGMKFAQLQAKLAISRLVQKFRFFPCEKTEDPLKLICPTVVINPANGIYLQAALRESSGS